MVCKVWRKKGVDMASKYCRTEARMGQVNKIKAEVEEIKKKARVIREYTEGHSATPEDRLRFISTEINRLLRALSRLEMLL